MTVLTMIIRCLLYLAVIGAAGFVVGRLMPKDKFKPDEFPFRTYKFERDGKIYERIYVKKWQNKIPDMSRILPFLMPKKAMSGDYASRLPVMIVETCVAEVTHMALAVLGFGCVFVWHGPGGIVASILYAIGNMPYIIVQRYNRPRFERLLKKSTYANGEGARDAEISVQGSSSR